MEVNSLAYREITADKILEFPATPGFKGWKPFFTDESTTHPAKMNLNLLRWIIETYTEPGEVILDPMAGTGSTIILAALMGRHGIAVEYEPRFCDMIRANIELTERQVTLTPKGHMTCIQGDARELSKIIEESEIIVTSPPYSGSVSTKGDPNRRADRMRKAGLDPKTIVGGRARSGEIDGRNYESKENIGNLPHGDIDAIISSPPYSEGLGHFSSKPSKVAIEKRQPAMGQKSDTGYGNKEHNIGNLPHGDIDTVITSPPYAKSVTGSDGIDWSKFHKANGTIRDRTREKALATGTPRGAGLGYSESKENIGNLSYGDIDSIITSPPFGPSTKGGGIFKEGYKAPGEEEVSDPGLPQRHARPLSDDPRNIDNLEYGESVDSIITSPPYASSLRHRDQSYEEVRKKLLAQGYSEEYIKASWSQPHQCQHWAEEAYGDDERNVGNLPQGDIDAVVTSPPYEAGPFDRAGGHGGAYAGGIAERDEKMKPEKISDENIGGLKSENYLQAMLQVYRECWNVLKQSGKLILVTKNFIRDKQVVRLDLDTAKLCEAAGFRLADRWYFKLPTRSFWRILYKKRFPHAPDIEYEDIMIFSKEERFDGEVKG